MRPKGYHNDNLIRFLYVILFVLANSFVRAETSPTNILFVGNSYTHMNAMPKIFERITESKGAHVNVEMDARSNHSFKMHAERADLFEHIREKKWDYVVLQGFSREMTFSPHHLDTSAVPYIQKIIDSVYANNSCTQVLFFMTWGYKTGFEHRQEIDTYEKMTDSIKRGYQYVSHKYNIPIVPVGYVYKAYRERSDIDLYDFDHQHPSYYGSYLIASTFYTAIFKTSPVAADYRKMTEVDATLIQQTAYDYVINNLDEYGLRNNSYNITFGWNQAGKLVAKYDANFENASEVLWDFGDGNSSNELKGRHTYRKIRQYTICLNVEDGCGSRNIQYPVELRALPNPEPEHPELPRIKKELRRATKRRKSS